MGNSGLQMPRGSASLRQGAVLQVSRPAFLMSTAPAEISSTDDFVRSFFHMQSHAFARSALPLEHAAAKSAFASASGSLPLHCVTTAFFASSYFWPSKSDTKSARSSFERSAVHSQSHQACFFALPPRH